LRVAVIGGGAAGMTAAIVAGRRGVDVTILEKNPRIGRKLLVTGNGRCNFTNVNTGVYNYHGKNPKFVHAALNRFDVNSTINFFERLGVVHKVEAEGKVFPFSNQASSVLDVLRYELREVGVEILCGVEVKDIKKCSGEFVLTLGDGSKFKAARVILATGGKAAPQLGASGSGYTLAQKMGHHIVEPFPALVQLKLASNFLKRIQGVKFDGDVEIIANGRSVQKASGEILFTEYGISGPPILCLSRRAGEYLQRKENVRLKLALINTFSPGELEQRFIERFRQCPGKDLAFSFVGFINKRLAPVILKEAGIEDVKKSAGQVSVEERKRILQLLLDWRFEITGTTSWPNAQVTAGGVDVKDIDNRTMESKIVPKLYFAGEIVDIDGDCGGYNLQWAWSSGFIAGESAAVPHTSHGDGDFGWLSVRHRPPAKTIH